MRRLWSFTTRIAREHPGWVLAVAVALWAEVLVHNSVRQIWSHPIAQPYDVYLAAAKAFLGHHPLYQPGTIDGFQYPPHAAILFTPMVWLGSPAGEVVWRAAGWALYAWGLWRVCQLLAPTPRHVAFLLATGLAFGASAASFRIGQYNLVIAALSLHAIADLITERWWRTAALLAIAVLLKPIALVVLLLLATLYRPLSWRVPVCLAVGLLAPLLVTDHAYLWQQYRLCVAKMSSSSQPDRLFEDLHGLVAVAGGWRFSVTTYRVLNLIGAVATWLACLRIRLRRPSPEAPVLIGAFAGAYLSLLDPRTQSNSYVLPVCAAAALAAWWLLDGRRRIGLAMSVICLAWAINVYEFHQLLRYWFKPLFALVFVGLLVHEALARETGRSAHHRGLPEPNSASPVRR